MNRSANDVNVFKVAGWLVIVLRRISDYGYITAPL